MKNKIQTIVFARSRVRVEIILTYLQELVKNQLQNKSIQGYRGGYLPKQMTRNRKRTSRGKHLRSSQYECFRARSRYRAVQVCVMTGYPGTVASAWRQAGRAGRRHGEAVIVMVASSSPLDQYMIQHPDYFFSRNPETARINPDNLVILVDHLKCASYEVRRLSREKHLMG